MARVIPWALLMSICAGCGGGGAAFHPEFPDNREGQLRAIQARLDTAAQTEAPGAILAITSQPRELVAFDLESGRRLWAAPASGAAIPFLAGDFAVSRDGADIVGRAVRDGAVRFSFPHGALGLVGAASEGSQLVISLSTGGGVGAQSRVVAIDGGRMVWSQRLEQAVGRPAVSGGMVFVPWATQNMSVVDFASGVEVARLRTSEQVIGHALTRGRHVFVGQERLALLSPRLADPNVHRAAFVSGTSRELPGRPTFLPDAYQPPPVATSAVHRIRSDWSPEAEGGQAVVRDGLVYVSFYKIVFALSAETGELRWTHELDADIVGAAVASGGLIATDGQGGVRLLSSEDGAVVWSTSLNARLEFAAVQAGEFSPPRLDTSTLPSVAEQLVSVIQNRDNRLVPARILAVQLLSTRQARETTGYLIDICDDDRLPGAVREASCLALAERDSGEQSVITALERRASFLERVSAPPVAALARAAARMGAQSAVPMLIHHLAEPDTPEADLAPLLVALRELDDSSATQSIRDFILLYHADLGGQHLGLALAEAARTLVALEGPVASELLRFVVSDFFSRSDLRQVSQELLDALRDNPESAGGGGEGTGATGDGTSPGGGLPTHINRDIVSAVLAPVHEQLVSCLRAVPGNPQSARIVIVLDGFGTIEAVRVLPAAAAECVEPLVRSGSFPGNRGRSRQQVTHTIRR